MIGERLGVLLKEWDPTGGLDISAAEPSSPKFAGPMGGRIVNAGLYNGITIETVLDPKAQPFLEDHQIDGTPVLPGVMGIEAFAEAAARLLPGWYVEAVEGVNFLAPFKFYRTEPRTLTIEAVIRPQLEGLIAECRLIGRRNLPTQAELQVTTHFTAQVRLSKQPPKRVNVPAPALASASIVKATDIYRIYFHGPAYQVVERAWWDGTHVVGLMAKGLGNNHQPADQPTLLAPRLIELCFQAAGLWELGVNSRMGLPRSVNFVSLLRAPEAAETRLYAIVTPHPEDACFDAQVVDEKGNCYLQLNGYRTVSLPTAVDSKHLEVLQSVMRGESVRAA